MSQLIPCQECEAQNPAGAAFCVECGVKLIVPASADRSVDEPVDDAVDDALADPPAAGRAHARSARAGRADRRRPSSGDAAERARARHEFARSKNIVLTVRSVYWSGVVFAVVQLLLYHVILVHLFRDEQSGTGLVVGLICWGQLGLMVAGALLVVRSPLVWTVVGACYWTLNTVNIFWFLWQTDWVLLQDTRALAFVTMLLLMVVSFWFAVAQAARVQRLMSENPDLQIVRRKLDPSQRVQGGVADEARERRRREARRILIARLRLLLVAGVSAVVLGFVIWFVTRPAGIGAALDGFTQRWAARDFDGLGKLLPGGQHGREGTTFSKAMGQRGWLDDPPELGAVQLDEHDKHAVAVFPCEGAQLRVLFRRHSDRWGIVDVALPELVVPGIAPGIAAFQKAWAAAGTEPLLALMRPENRDRAGKTLVRLLEKREWHEGRPPLGEVDPGQAGRARVRTTFAIDGDDMDVVFEYWHPQWWVSALRLPRE